MKAFLKVLLISFSLAILLAQCEKEHQVEFVNIPDKAFIYALIDEGVDTDGDSLISYAEAEAVNSIIVGGNVPPDGRKITDMTGIEAFINLDTLFCGWNDLSSLDVSKNVKLSYLDCQASNITNLNVSGCTILKELVCGSPQIFISAANPLTSLDLSNNVLLTELRAGFCNLASLDLSNNTALIEVDLRDNDLESLILPDSDSLQEIWAWNTYLKNLDISNNHNLTYLDLRGSYNLEEICVWTIPFPPEGVNIVLDECPNAYFTTGCSH